MITADTQFIYDATTRSLLCRLPSGQPFGFPLAEIAQVRGPDGLPFWKNIEGVMISLPHVGRPVEERRIVTAGQNDFAALRAAARKRR